MRLSLFLTFALVAGCSCSPNTRRDTGPGGGDTGPGGSESGAQCRDGFDNDGDGAADCLDPDCVGAPECEGVDAGPRRDSGFTECTAVESTAQSVFAPVDIVFVVDNSGSMTEEADQIQRRLNDFVAAIAASGIDDYHVVLITQMGFVSVPDPLGSDPAHYRFVNTDVQSHNSFSQILAQLSMFQDFLRPDAPLHLVFVTDDESDMNATMFESRFRTAVGYPFIGHAIVSPPGSTHREGPFNLPGCTGPGGDAAGNGMQYWSLASLTGGLHLSICETDWTYLFEQLLTLVAVPTRIPCRFLLPEAPEGMTLDAAYVNVVYTPGDGSAPITIPRAATGDCTGDGFTWVYDNITAPTEILLCGAACGTVDGDAAGNVRVQLGCLGILE